jgi:hypothetical protein
MEGDMTASTAHEQAWGEIDVPIFAPYEKTQPGYELVSAAVCEPGLLGGMFEDAGEDYFQVPLWDLWDRRGDPAASDPQKQRINEMQRSLGALSEDARLIRIQIACLDRCYFTFPANVDLVLGSIADGKPNLDARISCEPPWNNSLLPLLRRRRKQVAQDAAVLEARCARVRAYIAILSGWAEEHDPADLEHAVPEYVELARRIYRQLGAPSTLKQLYVQKLVWMLGLWAYPARYTPERWERHSKMAKVYGELIPRELNGAQDTISPLIDRNDDNGSCHHSFFRHIDHQMALIGGGGDLPGAGEERRRIHGAITNYVHVLGSWLARRSIAETVAIWPACGEVVAPVYQVLGEPTPLKRWLVACLWKRLQDHMAWRGRGALDEQPERFALPAEALGLGEA